MAKNNYEALNSQLLEELPLLTVKCMSFVKSCLSNFVEAKKLYLSELTEEIKLMLQVCFSICVFVYMFASYIFDNLVSCIYFVAIAYLFTTNSNFKIFMHAIGFIIAFSLLSSLLIFIVTLHYLIMSFTPWLTI